MFYKNNLKIIPDNLDKYLTPLALTTLFIFFSELRVQGEINNLALFICNRAKDLPMKYKSETNASLKELRYLSFILKNKYNIDTVIKDNKFNNSNIFKHLYIKNSSLCTFFKVIKPHLLYSQYYLLNLSHSGKSANGRGKGKLN